ncbi:MAG: LAS superfamily LD-carboxypeptidase LdcB [Paraglaciecola sp.]|jgi:LAS superfamily LD-carboxypeptidase LdcB
MLTTQQIIGQDPTHLVACHNQHFLQPTVCQAFKEMQYAASNDGIDLQIASSHRDFSRQLSIWRRKWLGELPLYDIAGERLETAVLSDSDKMHAILTWSALPGASRHHWGTDLDVYDKQAIAASGTPLQLVSAEYAQDGPCYRLNCWLAANAAHYDFSRPYAEYKGGVAAEAWHLSYHPIANDIYLSLAPGLIKSTIEDADLPGKDTVLSQFDGVFKRYILNKGLT